MSLGSRKQHRGADEAVNGESVTGKSRSLRSNGPNGRLQPAARPAKRRAPRIMRHSGVAKSLPADASLNLEHYLYGHPKR
jgi:hypothetical protein